MEYIAPPLQCILDLKMSVRSGLSIKMSVQNYLNSHDNKFSQQLTEWFVEVLKTNQHLSLEWPSYYSKSLVDILYRGLQGEPVLKSLDELESELKEECKARIDKYMQKLAILSLFPLLFLQFPAFMLLLFGPIFNNVLEQLV